LEAQKHEGKKRVSGIGYWRLWVRVSAAGAARLVLGAAVLSILLFMPVGGMAAQELITATPIPIVLVTPTPDTGALQQPTSSPTWTATPPALAVLEPIDSANVRAEPDIGAQQLGVIRAGERYTVTGRYFQWYQFLFPSSPNGLGWVFGELVNVSGDAGSIPEITDEPLPTVDPALLGATLTVDVIALTPGGAETATAAARGIVATLQLPQSGNGIVQAGGTAAPAGPSLPTFTPPPGVFLATPTPVEVAQAGGADEDLQLEITTEDITNLPPIVPILVLAGLGIAGFVLSGLGRK
jgi:hypothetical protein